MAGKQKKVRLYYTGLSDIREVGKADGLSKEYKWKGPGSTCMVSEEDAKILLEKTSDFCRRKTRT